MGIISNGQVIMEHALYEFARCFKGQVSRQVIMALRALFKLVDPLAAAIDKALIEHGGDGALDVGDEDASANV
jgi:hypothetical protein